MRSSHVFVFLALPLVIDLTPHWCGVAVQSCRSNEAAFFPFSFSLTTIWDNMTSRLSLYSLVLTLVFTVDQVEMQSWMCDKCTVGSWMPWSSCAQPCGVQYRARQIINICDFNCPTLVESRPCNTGCYYGGTLIPERNGECSCPSGYSGQCCSQIDGKNYL